MAIVQSGYIPWKGYFDIIRSADEFFLLDNVQYTRRDWRNRNLIYTAAGLAWLTIPVEVRGRYHQTIGETRVADRQWARKHWSTITHNYRRAPFFEQYAGAFGRAYGTAGSMQLLSQVNLLFIELINSILGITTPVITLPSSSAGEDKNQRLVSICLDAGAGEYLTGPSAKAYIDEQLFAASGIRIVWADYSGYPEYPQLHTPFQHGVSIIDLLFNTGSEAVSYMKDSVWTCQ